MWIFSMVLEKRKILIIEMDRFIWQILSDRTYKPNTGNCDGEEGIRGTNKFKMKFLKEFGFLYQSQLIHCLNCDRYIK